MIVCPGFIDSHSHSDFVYFVDSTAQSKIRQGVTTEVTGNCGLGTAPWTDRSRHSNRLYGFSPDWTNFEEYVEALATIDKPVNIGPLVGHGTLRAAIVGLDDRPCKGNELEEMKRVLKESLKVGAFGMSTGLHYSPGSYATNDELIALGKCIARYNAILTSHIRDESSYTIGFLGAIREIIAIGEEARVPIQISHLKALGPDVWGQATEALELIERARKRGVEVSCDQYPYAATGGGLASSMLPHSFRAGKTSEDYSRELRDPQVKAQLKDVVGANIKRRGGPGAQTISEYPAEPKFEGKTLQEIAEELGIDPASVVLDLLAEGKGRTASLVTHALKEEDVENIMRYPGTMIGSDGAGLSTTGPLSQGFPHPRHFGAFPRVLRRYVREKKILRLEDAIRKMTTLPAQTFGLPARGAIEEGNWADIVVFDEERLTDASYENPKQYPQGIPYVMVNGEWVIKKGNFTGSLPGQVLRHKP